MDSPNAPQSALDVLRTVEFKLGLKGYNVDDVDEFLERAAVEAEHLKDQLRQQQQQLRQAAERINQLETERRAAAPAVAAATAIPPPAPAAVAVVPSAPVSAMPGTEQVTRMIGLAQQFIDQTQQEAESRARELTAAAQDKAREIVAEAQNRAQDEVTRLNGLKQRLSEDVEKLARQVDQERARLRTQLTDFLRWVEENLRTGPPAPEAPAIERPSEPAQREMTVATTPPPASASTATSVPSASTLPPPPPVPPPAPPRVVPTTIGQVLNFDSDDRS